MVKYKLTAIIGALFITAVSFGATPQPIVGDTTLGPYQWDGNTEIKLVLETTYSSKAKSEVRGFKVEVTSTQSNDASEDEAEMKTYEFTKEEVDKAIAFIDRKYKDGAPQTDEKTFINEGVVLRASFSGDDDYLEISLDPTDWETKFRIYPSDVPRVLKVMRMISKAL